MSKRDSNLHPFSLHNTPPRRICFVTGTRAEFGLMQRVLLAIRGNSSLTLQLIVTGMHLDPAHGRSINLIRKAGWKVDAVIPWHPASSNSVLLARQTGNAIAKMAEAFDRLRSDIILVTGDRVEAFAAATAAHISQKVLAHVHGGDRAAGQIDDSLRHAISKLAHIHLPATAASATRLLRLGEQRWRIHAVGSPGIDNIKADASTAAELKRQFPLLIPRRYVLIVLHPISTSQTTERQRAQMILTAVQASGVEHSVIVYPNNDPGAEGIIQCWNANRDQITYQLPNANRQTFLGLLRDAAVLVGNSSSGIIEAASFGTPVIDIGPRQDGRERSQNVMNVPYSEPAIRNSLKHIWNHAAPKRWRGRNIYGGKDTAKKICNILTAENLDNPRLRSKLITY